MIAVGLLEGLLDLGGSVVLSKRLVNISAMRRRRGIQLTEPGACDLDASCGLFPDGACYVRTAADESVTPALNTSGGLVHVRRPLLCGLLSHTYIPSSFFYSYRISFKIIVRQDMF
jgi:hypothetical protein